MNIPPLLVLGATGRIGTLLRKCWGRDLRMHQVLWQTRGRVDRAGPGWTRLDPLAQPEALARAATGVEVILCLAGVVSGPQGPKGDLSDNAALADAAIRAGAATGARVLLASSAAVYGNQAGMLDETTPLAALSDYGRAKMDMERRGATLGARLGVAVCALRIGNIAGLDAILGGWKPGFQLDRFKDGRSPRRSYIGMATLARVLGDLVRVRDLPGALNIAAPGLVEMGVLLDAAGLAWSARAAPDSAIPELALSTQALAQIVALPQSTRPEELVAEWRVVQEASP